MTPAPIALFVYNRLEHTRMTIEALKKNGMAVDSDVFIFCDGAKSESGREKVDQVRASVRTIRGFKSVTIIERDGNLGLAQSIISGVTELVNKYGRVIVLEDDMVTSPHFLRYMNDALEFYKDDERVISIHGYIYPVKEQLPETFFLKGADCWGWATWKRGWDLFEPDGKKLLEELRTKKLTREFDFDGSYGYTRMLENQVRGRNNSWAIRWYASAFLKNKLTLYPGLSLVRNIGMDASGTHCIPTDEFSADLADRPIRIEPVPVEESSASRRAFAAFLKRSEEITVSKLFTAARTKVKRFLRV